MPERRTRMPHRLTYAIGDIHGCYQKLTRLLDRCIAHCGAAEPHFVFIGDYVDRGPNSREVVDLLIAVQAEAPDWTVCLRGNHEQMLIDACENGDEMLWLFNGGGATLESYDVGCAADIPAEHLPWFKELPFAISDGK